MEARDHERSREVTEDDAAATPPDHASKLPNPGSANACVNDSPSTPASPRAALVVALTEAVQAAVAMGEIHAARVAHEALGRLLDDPDRDPDKVTDVRAARE